jgi:SAM-dependent methyltransferase
MSELPDYIAINRDKWNAQADEWVKSGERLWRCEEPEWGIWGIPEKELQMLPAKLEGLDVIELGCGTGYVSAWMARRGARVTAIDNSERQLETARRLQLEHELEFPLLHGFAESVPLPDESIDFAISEYGAAIWADPYQWIPEAFRLLRPGGRLHFMGSSPLSIVCSPSSGGDCITGCSLEQPYFGMYKVVWPDKADGIEFQLPISEWFRLFHKTGFEIIDYLEPRPANGTDGISSFTTRSWAQKFPSEQVWKLRKTG